MNIFYNRYHKKNKGPQVKLISRNNYTYQYLLNFIDKHFSKSSKTVIDVGCGVGTIDFYLANKDFQVLGIDISERAIGLARQSKKALSLSNVDFRVGDISSGVEPDTVFNYAICSEVIEHVKDDKKLVVDLFNLLKEEGTLILSTPSLNAPLYRWGLLDDFDDRVGHLRRYSMEGLSALLESAGFKIVEIRRTEGLLRNFLFTHDKFGFILKFFKWPITIPVNFIDYLLLKLFGESNIYVVAKK